MTIAHHRPRSGGARLVLVIVVLLIVVVGAILLARRGAGVAPIPQIEMAGLEPAVQRRLEERLATLRDDPGSSEAWGRLGVALDVHERDALAVTCYEQAAALDDEAFLWPYLLGNCLSVGDRAAALAYLRRAVALNDALAPAHHRAGHLLLLADDLDGADAAFRNAIDRDASLVCAHLGRAKVALQRDDAPAALAHLDAALALGPRAREVHHLLAEAYRRTGAAEDAARHDMRAGLEWLPEPVVDPVIDGLFWEEGVSLDWRRRRSRLYAAQGKMDEFVAEWEAAREDDPTSAEPLIELAEAYFIAGKTKESLSAYDRALELDPDDALVHLGRGIVLVRLREAMRAIKSLELALELDPYLHEARSNLGALLMRTGKPEEGRALIQEAAAAMPNDANAQMNVAMAFKSTGELEEAAQAFERVLGIDPTRVRARFELATFLAQERRLEEAARHLEIIIATNPEQGAAYANLAQVFMELRRFDDALAVYRAGLEADPDHPMLLARFAWIMATHPDEQYRNGHAAVTLAQKLCKSSRYRNPDHIDILAAACAERGDWDVATRYAGDTVQLLTELQEKNPAATAHPDRIAALQRRIEEAQARLELYLAKKPFRDVPWREIDEPQPGEVSNDSAEGNGEG